jgi:hypothetical protein
VEDIMKELKLSPWHERLGLAAGALLAVVLSLGGVAALFASQSGELDQVVAWFKSAPGERPMAGEPPRKQGV